MEGLPNRGTCEVERSRESNDEAANDGETTEPRRHMTVNIATAGVCHGADPDGEPSYDRHEKRRDEQGNDERLQADYHALSISSRVARSSVPRGPMFGAAPSSRRLSAGADEAGRVRLTRGCGWGRFRSDKQDQGAPKVSTGPLPS